MVSDFVWEDILFQCQHLTLLERARLDTFRRLAADLPEGDLAELGVYLGGVCLALKGLCPHRRVWAFDTFEGMPALAEPDEPALTPGRFLPLTDVKTFLVSQGIMTVKGVLPQNFPEDYQGKWPAGTARFALVHLDADLYVSTYEGLKFFWPRMNPGGYIVLDDYGRPECPGVARAVEEFTVVPGGGRHRITADNFYSVDVTLNQLVLRKPL